MSLDTRCRWIPQERETSFAPPPAPPPVGPFSLTVTGTPLKFDITDSRWPDPDPLDTPYSSSGGPPPLPASGGPSTESVSGESDGGLLYGPDLDLELGRGLTGWMSSDVEAHLYGRGLFGELNLVGVDTDVQMYSVGARVRVAILTAGPFEASAHASGGPGWLLAKDLGEATGVDAAAGLGGELRVSSAVHLTAGVEAHGFWSEDLRGWGPAFLMGLNLGW